MAAGGEEGIEMKDFSTSLRRREESEGRDLTTRNCSNKENESGTCMHNHYSRMPNSETGLPILELDATSPVTKNTLQISSEKPYQHMLDVYRTPPFAFNSQSPGVSKNSTDVCNNENRTLTTADRSSSIVIRSPLRRSVRLAKRRSVGQCAPQAAGYLSSPLLKDSGSSNFPVPSLLSPVSKIIEVKKLIWKYWRELNLVVKPKIAITRILADLKLAVRYGIAIHIYATRKFWRILIWRL